MRNLQSHYSSIMALMWKIFLYRLPLSKEQSFVPRLNEYNDNEENVSKTHGDTGN